MGGVQNSSGNSGGVGWGGYFSGQKMEIPGRRGGLREIPSVVGVWIFSGTTHCHKLILAVDIAAYIPKLCFSTTVTVLNGVTAGFLYPVIQFGSSS